MGVCARTRVHLYVCVGGGVNVCVRVCVCAVEVKTTLFSIILRNKSRHAYVCVRQKDTKKDKETRGHRKGDRGKQTEQQKENLKTQSE